MNDTNPPNQWPGRAEPEPADQHVTAPIGPPPAGAPVGLIEQPAPEPEDVDWQGKYESERKRSRIFIAATAVAAALFVGSLFYASAQGGSTAGTDLADQPGMSGGLGVGPQDQGPGLGSRGFGDDSDSDSDSGPGMSGGMGVPPGFAEQFFSSDGTLNSAAVEQFREQLEAAGTSADTIKEQLAAHIAGDVTRGHLTQEQADELSEALGLDLASGDTSGGTDGNTDSNGTGT